MEKEVNPELANFLFDIVKQVKQFYETPVVFYTKKDYSDNIFNTLCTIRKAFLEDVEDDQANNLKNKVIDLIVDYHLQWLHAVNEMEKFKKRVESKNIDKEEVIQAVSFTIDAMKSRLKYFMRYVDNHKVRLNNTDHVNINADLEIVEEMHLDVVAALEEKLKCFNSFDCPDTFRQKVILGIDELFHYYDKLNDALSVVLAKYINLNLPQLTGNLTNTLQQIVDEIHNSNNESCLRLVNDLKERGIQLSTMVRSTAPRNLEISKTIDKINILEDRIFRMGHEQSAAAVLALQNKKDFLEMRLASLENMKTTIKQLNEGSDFNYDNVPETEICECADFFQLRIFNHLLPVEGRERLVTELCFLWDLAVFGDTSRKSLISILSATEIREEFTDELGTYYIDDHNRKIYKKSGSETLYQPNENNELVPLNDDKDHVYSYDECGRFYVCPQTREKIYKAHPDASEYVIDTGGVLLKVKEERYGKTYHYDNYGRYYINEDGKHIYQDEDGASEYEHDGLGNLIRIRTLGDILEPCPDDVNVSDDFKYLKCVVGAPLRRCIADVILHHPADPIKYLAQGLVKYRENMQFRDTLLAEREALEVERERIRAEERAAAEKAALEALLAQGGSEASYDTNLVQYKADVLDDSASATTTN